MTTVQRAAVLVGALCLCGLAVLGAARPVLAEEERKSGYYSLVERRSGRVICRTGLMVHAGDRYLTAENFLYRVTNVQGATAYAECVGHEELRAPAASGASPLTRFMRAAAGLLGLAKARPGPVAIYHTHSDESYVPTEGAASKPGQGGVYQVGRALAVRLREAGLPVTHAYTNHDPHDGMAYERSRRTAVDLLRRNPIALFDIHRDSGPRQEYAAQVDDVGVTKVQIVIGRSNPGFKANEAFAKQIKAVVDRRYPGFIKGIYYGTGRYNQDLSPRALLLELGTERNSREAAERGARVFGDAARSVVATVPGRSPLGWMAAGGAWRALLYVLGAALAAMLIYLFLNAGSLRGAGRDLRRFFGREFASALGAKTRAKRRRPEKREEGRDK